jgi:glutamyl-tRNA reductase
VEPVTGPLALGVWPRRPDGALEALNLKTCWRDEWYALCENPDGAEFTGPKAAMHLIRVLLGLESFAVGEFHIVNQVKRCYREQHASCGPVLHRLFQRSFRAARLIRGTKHPGRAPSIPYLAASALKDHPGFPRLRVLVAGMGEMGREAAKVLSYLGCHVTCTSRSSPPPPGLPWVGWGEFLSGGALRGIQGLFLCTGADRFVVEPKDLRGSGIWVVDLGSPPQCGPGEGYRYVGIGEIAEASRGALRSYRQELAAMEEAASEAALEVWEEMLGRFPEILGGGSKTGGIAV